MNNIVPPKYEIRKSSLSVRQMLVNALLGLPAAVCVGGMLYYFIKWSYDPSVLRSIIYWFLGFVVSVIIFYRFSNKDTSPPSDIGIPKIH